MNTFGQLRSLLHTPSPTHWRELLALLNAWEDHDDLLERALPYALEHLQPWPDVMRRLPESWLEEPAQVTPSALWELIRSIKASLSPAQLDALARAPFFQTLRHLDLEQGSLDAGGSLQALFAPWAGQALMLERLYLRHNHRIDEPGLQALLQTRLDHLRELLWVDCNLGDAALIALTEAELPRLEHLELSPALLSEQVLRAFHNSPLFEQLQTFGLERCVLDDSAQAYLQKHPELSRHIQPVESDALPQLPCWGQSRRSNETSTDWEVEDF